MRTKNIFIVCVLAGGLFSSGCGQPPAGEAQKSKEPASSARESAAPKKTVDPATAATLKGKVIFQGQPPEPKNISVRGNPECAVFHKDGNVQSEELLVNAAGGIKNAFVYIKEGLEGWVSDAPAQPATIENKNCLYVPHVSGVMVNQPVVLLNADPTLHNVHTYSKNSGSWNLGMPIQGMKVNKKFSAPEIMVTLKCDVHPWMVGYVGVLPHPYFSVTGESGEFELKNLPPGKYVIEVWHEKLGTQSQTIEIGSQKTKEIEFKF